MAWVKMAGLVLGAVWFFPASCTSLLGVGTHVAAKLDEREVARGDEVHRAFMLVAEPGEDGRPFLMVRLAGLAQFRQAGVAHTFLMSKPSATLTVNGGELAFRVLEDRGAEQLIEASFNDGDSTVWSRYRATRDDVTPLASRMFHVWHLYRALPYAFGIALAIFGIGRYLRRRARADQAGGAA